MNLLAAVVLFILALSPLRGSTEALPSTRAESRPPQAWLITDATRHTLRQASFAWRHEDDDLTITGTSFFVDGPPVVVSPGTHLHFEFEFVPDTASFGWVEPGSRRYPADPRPLVNSGIQAPWETGRYQGIVRGRWRDGSVSYEVFVEVR